MAQEDPNKEDDRIKLVVYDFDQTISSKHIYHALDEMAQVRSAKGQCDELAEMELDDLHDMFGGKDRITRLTSHFERVSSLAQIAIVSFGYVSVIKESLNLIKLSEYFENATIIGCDSVELKQVHGNKAQCIQSMRKKNSLKSNQVLFVDDDSTNIRKAKTSNVCETLEIKPRNGMSNKHMDEIETKIGYVPEKNTNSNNSNNNSNDNSVANSNNNNNNNNNSNSNNGNNNNNNNNTNNNGNNDDNDKNNSNSTDDSKEPMNRQPSWKTKYIIDKDKDNLLDNLLNNNNEDSEGTPVVDVDVNHESESESNDNEQFVLETPPVLPNGNKD